MLTQCFSNERPMYRYTYGCEVHEIPIERIYCLCNGADICDDKTDADDLYECLKQEKHCSKPCDPEADYDCWQNNHDTYSG